MSKTLFTILATATILAPVCALAQTPRSAPAADSAAATRPASGLDTAEQ